MQTRRCWFEVSLGALLAATVNIFRSAGRPARKGGKVALDLREKALRERLPERIFTRIHGDIGAASACWSHLEGAGTFETERAAAIALNLCQFIADELDRGRSGEV